MDFSADEPCVDLEDHGFSLEGGNQFTIDVGEMKDGPMTFGARCQMILDADTEEIDEEEWAGVFERMEGTVAALVQAALDSEGEAGEFLVTSMNEEAYGNTTLWRVGVAVAWR